ncbi:MAG: hypothetical protein ACK5ZG_05775 [Phycisphaerae bacterium]|jgi:hypothetical protein
MAQFGMQAPAGRQKKASGLNVYTALAALACVSLAVACAVIFMYGSRVGKDGNALGLQEPGKIQLPKP